MFVSCLLTPLSLVFRCFGTISRFTLELHSDIDGICDDFGRYAMTTDDESREEMNTTATEQGS